MRKDKARDIARGVLPSTARKGARDNKRNFHAKHRHAQRQANHAIERTLATVSDHGTVVHDPELYDDFEDREIFDGYHASTKDEGLGWDDLSASGEIIYSRRAADKLGPLISWARATEKRLMAGWDVADKVAYFKAVLPDTLQGRHALGHVKSALDLDDDEFGFRFYRNRPEPISLDVFRGAVAKCLSNTKARRRLRDVILDVVPVAAHSTTTSNKIRSTEPVVDENGNYRYKTVGEGANRRTYRITTTVYVPQTVTVACDDCSFLRNDPLGTTEAVNHFVNLVWPHRTVYRHHRYMDSGPHPFMREIRDYILAQR